MSGRNTKKTLSQGKTTKKRRTNFASVLLTVVFAALILIFATIFFKIGEIEINGAERYTPEEIASKSGLKTGDNLFLFDKYSVIDKITSAMPYIDTVLIRRALPSTLVINVTERPETGVLYTGEGYVVVDENLRALNTITPAESGPYMFLGEDGAIPYIKGCTAKAPVTLGRDVTLSSEDKRETMIEILSAVNSLDMTKNMREIDVDKLYDIKLKYREDYTITLGNSDEIERKLKRVDPVIKVVGEDMGGIIDVSDSAIARYRGK